MQKTKPIVRNDWLVIDDAGLGESTTIRLGTRQWQAWLSANRCFIFEGNSGGFSARRELRRGVEYWYAYRRRRGRLFKMYLGRAEALTQARLEHVSARLAGQSSLAFLSSASDSVDWATALEHQVRGPDFPNGAETEPSFWPMSKVRPPALPEKLIARPHLTRRIAGSLTLLCAPSGFGKSTLLNEWQQSCAMPVAWVSLDKDDDHPLRFWSLVAKALQTIHPDLGQAILSQFHTSSPAVLSELVVNLTNDILRVTESPGPFSRLGLVLDDYHHIHAPEIHASFQAWLKHLPSALHLVISSCTKPPFALGDLRGKGLVSELETDDLRFTTEEGVGFLSAHAPSRSLAYSDMQTLVKRTEGWAAGLVLATLALARQDDKQRFMTTFSGAHTFLREYFTESVLREQPPPVQSFLYKTAVLKHLTGGLCDAVTGQTGGAELLSRLWQENLFLVRMEEQGWYRYHDLFAEMLYSQLQAQFPLEIPRLHRQAAEWYRANNSPTEAVQHLLAIEAWEEAAALIEGVALRELEQLGEDSRLLRWLQQLPETVVQQHKTLLFVYMRLAWMALSRSEVEQFLERIETRISRKPADEQTGDERDVWLEIQRIRQWWATGDEAMPPLLTGGKNDVWQMLNGIVQYLRYLRQAALDRAETVARETYEIASARQHLFVVLMTGGTLANCLIYQGQLRRGERVAHQVLSQALAQRGRLPEPASIPLAALSRVCYERNELTQAQQILERAAEVDPNPTSTNQRIAIAVLRAKIQTAQGKNDAALATIQAARELHTHRPSSIWLDRDLMAYEALVWWKQGDCAAADRLLNAAGDVEGQPLSMLVGAEILFEQKQAQAAQDLLKKLIARYPRGWYSEPILGARVLLALTLFELHAVRRARRTMLEAVRLAAPEGMARPFLDYGSQTAPLLTLVLHTGNLSSETRSFVTRLLHLLGEAGGSKESLSKKDLSTLSTAASISAREQQVLQLVGKGLSNREIAAQFSISDCTVKTHLKSIYRKLGVNSRTRAIAQAQTLKLI